MRASAEWIASFLPNSDSDPERMARELTDSGTEVESVQPVEGGGEWLDIGVTSNRVDCLCHLGLARELSAVRGESLTLPERPLSPTGSSTSEAASVAVSDAEGCPRYIAHVLEGVRIGPSPEWLVKRLEAAGQRSINNVVDVTNYILLERNQPLHAFDLERLRGGRIVVRRAQDQELLELLDGKRITLDSADLVIADAERPMALAGVMGGADSEVREGTTRLLLEAAYFAPATVRRSARRHGLATDSSHRFERRVDRAAVAEAAEHAVALILEVAGGSVRPDPLDVGGPGEAPAMVPLASDAVRSVSAVDVPAEQTVQWLERIGCRVVPAPGGDFAVHPPSWRADLTRPIDLVEEVVRLHGLDAIPERSGMAVRTVRPLASRERRELLADRFARAGLLEAVTPDFVPEGPEASLCFLAQGDGLAVTSPVRAGEGALRRSLLPSLLAVRKLNQDRAAGEVRIFESTQLAALRGGEVVSTPVMGVLIDGEARDLRGVLDAVLWPLGVEYTIRQEPVAGLEEAAGGRLLPLGGGEAFGVFGHPERKLAKRFGLKAKVCYAEFAVEALAEAIRLVRTQAPLARFPASERDLAVIVPEGVAYGAIESAVRRAQPAHLEAVSLFDIYRGEQAGAGKKSLALRFRFRRADATLESEAIDRAMEAIIAAIHQDPGGEIRGL